MPISHDEIAAARTRALSRWPLFELDELGFAAHVTRLGLEPGALAAHGEDVFLAAACLRGCRRALAELDAGPLAKVPLYVGRIGKSSDFPSEVAQHLREKLLTGEAPKLASYAGRAPLSEWVRAAAVRAALNLSRSERRTVIPIAPLEIMKPGHGEVPLLAARHQGDFRRALELAFGRLEPRDRTLLRLHFVDHVALDRLGEIYGVHRATVARWIAGLRRRLFEEIAAELGAELGWHSGTIRSAYRAFSGELGVSVASLLATSQ